MPEREQSQEEVLRLSRGEWMVIQKLNPAKDCEVLAKMGFVFCKGGKKKILLDGQEFQVSTDPEFWPMISTIPKKNV